MKKYRSSKKQYKKGGDVDPPKIPFTKEEIREMVKSGNTQMYYGPDRSYNQDEFPWLNTSTPREGSDDIYVSPENYPTKSIYIDDVEEDGTVRGRWAQRGSGDSLDFNRVEYNDFVLPGEQRAVSLPRKNWRSEVKPLKMVDPFPNVYGRRMDVSGNRVIYDTDKGRVIKKPGPEDAEFTRLMMRLGRRYR